MAVIGAAIGQLDLIIPPRATGVRKCSGIGEARAACTVEPQSAACIGRINRDIDRTTVDREAIQALGGNGYINEYPTGRFLRDAKLYEIGAGTSEIRRMLIGRELFNESK